MGTVKESWENEETKRKRGEHHGAIVYKKGILVGEYPSTYQAFIALGLPQEKHIVFRVKLKNEHRTKKGARLKFQESEYTFELIDKPESARIH
jgi:hypothetical protein